MVTKAQKKATEKYEQHNYDKVLLRIKPKGKREKIKAAADAKGQSLNSFINEAIDEHMEQLGHKNRASE
jgi:predicted HicB family RNase H-like nuclease